MHEGREKNQVSVSWTILGPDVLPHRVYLERDSEKPDNVYLTLDPDDAIAYRGSRLSH